MEMVTEQSMTKAAMLAAINAIKEAYNPVSNARLVIATPRLSSPTLKQTIFNGQQQAKYQVLCNLEVEIKKS